MKPQDLVPWALGAGMLYALYKIIGLAKDAGDKAGETLAQPFVDRIMANPVTVKGQLIVGNNRYDWATLTKRDDFKTWFVGDKMQVSFGGQQITVTTRDANGNYIGQSA